MAIRRLTSLDGAGHAYWKQSSHPILYGEWKLGELMQACSKKGGYENIIFLVRGEINAQTLWYYEIPALGVPDATQWKSELRDELLSELTVYVWQEPGKAGEQFVKSIGNEIPGIKIIMAPQGRKEITDCHILGDNVPEVLTRLMSQAVPFQVMQEEASLKGLQDIRQKAALLFQSDILEEVITQVRDLGLTGEEKNVKLVYLALTSRLLERPISVVVKGPSSGGKSFNVGIVLNLFPHSAYYQIASLSDKALFYSSESFVHRFLIMQEAGGMSSEFISLIIRILLSEGRIRHQTVVKTDKGMEELVLDKEGPTGFITTTTAISLHPENETRMFSIAIDDDPKQTKRIMQKIAEGAMGKTRTKITSDKFIAFQVWLEKEGKHEVIVPFAEVLADLIPPIAVRIRRDFKTLIQLISTVAMVYQLQRKLDEVGRIIATLEDYQIVFNLVAEVFNEAVEGSFSLSERKTVDSVKELLMSVDPDTSHSLGEGGMQNLISVDISTLAKKLGLDSSSTSRRVKKAVADGFLENLESRRGCRAKIVLGRKIPEDLHVLPSPEELKNKWVDLPEIVATVQHLPDGVRGQNEQLPIE